MRSRLDSVEADRLTILLASKARIDEQHAVDSSDLFSQFWRQLMNDDRSQIGPLREARNDLGADRVIPSKLVSDPDHNIHLACWLALGQRLLHMAIRVDDVEGDRHLTDRMD